MNDTFKDPRFWAAHYYLLIGDDDHDSGELVESLFGLRDEALQAYYFGDLVKPDDQSTPLWLPLAHGYQAGVQYADCGDDGHEVRYLLGHATWPEPELVGFDSPHFALPAFRWQELVQMHDALGPVLGSLAATLLFAGTYVTDADDEEQVVATFADWWTSHPILVPPQPRRVAANAAAYRRIPGFSWRYDEELGWINDELNSLRNPETRMRTFSRDRFERVRSFFTAFK